MGLSLFEIAELRQKFLKPTGELIEQFFPFDNERALNFQAGLIALKTKHGDRFNAFAERNADTLQDKILENQITDAELATARAVVDAKAPNGAMKDVPPLGIIAVKLGMVTEEQKDLLLQAQAAVRILERLDEIEHRWFAKPPVLKGEVYDPNGGSAKSFIGNKSPAELTNAQALNHIVDIFGAVASDAECYRGFLTRLQGFNGRLEDNFFAIRLMAAEYIDDAVKKFAKEGNAQLSEQLASILSPQNQRLAFHNHKIGEGNERIKSYTFNMFIKALAAPGCGYDGVKIDDLENLLQTRLDQVQGKVVARAK